MTARTVEEFPIDVFLQMVTVDKLPPDGSLKRMFYRAKERGHVSVGTADCLSIRMLGVHPCFVWGDAWWSKDTEAVA